MLRGGQLRDLTGAIRDRALVIGGWCPSIVRRKLLRIWSGSGASASERLASICRMRSRVTENAGRLLQRVMCWLRCRSAMRSTRSSPRGERRQHRVVVYAGQTGIAASIGSIAFVSAMKSPR